MIESSTTPQCINSASKYFVMISLNREKNYIYRFNQFRWTAADIIKTKHRKETGLNAIRLNF